MSGIYLVVWDEEQKEQSVVLKATKGGYPHCTLVYSGKHLTGDHLIELSNAAMATFALKQLVLSKSYVNSFTKEDGTERYDVLMEVENTEKLERFRTHMLKSLGNADKLFMNPLHVTHAIYSTKEEAEEGLKQLDEHLPKKVVITGVTID